MALRKKLPVNTMIMQKYFKVTRNEWSELILATAEDYFALNKRMAIMRFVT